MNHHKFANSLIFVSVVALIVVMFFLVTKIAKDDREYFTSQEESTKKILELRARIIEACFQKGGVPLLEHGDLKDCKI